MANGSVFEVRLNAARRPRCGEAAEHLGISTADVIAQTWEQNRPASRISGRLYVSLRAVKMYRFRSRPFGLLYRILEWF